MAETLGQMVRRLRESLGFTQGQLAANASVTRSWIARVEADDRQRPDPDMLKRVASHLQVPANTLLATAGYNVLPEPERPDRTPEEIAAELAAALRRDRQRRERDESRYTSLPYLVRMIPIVESFASAGEGAVGAIEMWPYMPPDANTSHDFFAIYVRGDCLAPRVSDGDLAVIDKQATPELGDVVAVQSDGESLLRVYDGDRLLALNGHPPKPLDERTHLEGVVVFAGRKP